VSERENCNVNDRPFRKLELRSSQWKTTDEKENMAAALSLFTFFFRRKRKKQQ